MVDFGFSDDINRRIEINYDPTSAKYPIPKYLKRITDSLFSKATAREIFMVKLDSMSKLKSSKKWKSKGRLPLAAIDSSKKSFKRSQKDEAPDTEEKKPPQPQPKAPVQANLQNRDSIMAPSKLVMDNSILHKRNVSQKSQIVNEKSKILPNKLKVGTQANELPVSSKVEINSKDKIFPNDWVLPPPSLESPIKNKAAAVAPQSEDSLKEDDYVLDVKSEQLSSISKISIEKLKQDPDQRKKLGNDLQNVKCVVCCSHEPDCVVMPCGHAGVCNYCSINIFDSNGKCPICRAVKIGNLGHRANLAIGERWWQRWHRESHHCVGD